MAFIRKYALPVTLVTGLILFFFTGTHKLVSWETISSNYSMLKEFANDRFLTSYALFLLLYLIVVAFSQYVLDSYFLFRQKSLKMSFLGRWNGVFYFFPLVLFSLAALEVLPTTLSEIISTGGKLLVWGLTLSTLASIADRAIAPLRE